uniref:Phosphodiesterase n=1 Tax=Gouania willdenowi TaxID=441366 RepID=A0A8C5I2T0_GOUWI
MFYTSIIQSVLCTSITVWFGSSTKLDRHRLQRIVRTAEKIIGVDLPSIQDLYLSRVRKRAGSITADPSHPAHNLFKLLPSGRRYRSLYAKTTHRLAPFALNLTTPEWTDRFCSDVLRSHSPCCPRSPRSAHSSRFSFSPCRPLSPICPSSPDFPSSPYLLTPTVTKTPACAHGEGCPWMMGMLGGGLSCVVSVADLCQSVVLHTGMLLGAEGTSLALVRKDCDGKRNLEVLTPLTALGCVNEETLYSQAHRELVKGLMGCVLATSSPVNLRDASEDPRFILDSDQASKISAVLCVPIKNHRREVIAYIVLTQSLITAVHFDLMFSFQVLFNHMDVFGMILDNIQLYESSRQEAKRSQALLEMAQVLSKEHHSFGILLSKMAATIMPFTHAQYCTIFIPTFLSLFQICFSRIIHLECEELGSSCQIYRRERDIIDVDPSYALQSLMAVKTLNISKVSDDSRQSLVCCPVTNEQSENVIAVCQLMNKRCRDSGELEAFNRYDERLLEDLAVYCGLALQYVQAVKITEERKASIEVTREVLAYHISATEQEIEALQEATIPSAESLHLFDFHFSGFGLQEDLTTQAAVRMFLDLHLVQDFSIDYKSLCQWVLTVRRGYRNNVPYHNWNHALSTAQSMFAMLMATGQLQNIFTRLEILALMVSTLSHDLDHRGVNNSYIERTHQPLSQLYGHSSLENHHYNLCVFILNNTGNPILSGLSTEQHRTVLHMIKRAILATDLSVYMQRRKDFFSLLKKKRVNWKSEPQRDLLRSMLMTASDLSAVTKPWSEHKKITKLVAMEFFAQGDKEKEEFKIKPLDIMNRENSTRLPCMQVEYIDDICYPLYKVCNYLLTKVDFYVQNRAGQYGPKLMSQYLFSKWRYTI